MAEKRIRIRLDGEIGSVPESQLQNAISAGAEVLGEGVATRGATGRKILESKPVQFGLQTAATVGRALDRILGAPTRKAIGELQEGDIPGAVTGAISQPFRAPETAPTGRQIMRRSFGQEGLGLLSDRPISEGVLAPAFSESGEGLRLKKGGLLDVSPEGVGGFAMDVVADPFIVGKGLGLAGKGAARVAPKTTAAITQKAADIASKTGEAITGLPRETIKIIGKRGAEIDKIDRKYRGNVAEATSDLKTKISDALNQLRKKQNKTIESVLQGEIGAKGVEVKPVIEKLEAGIARFDDIADKDKIKMIQDEIKTIQSMADNEGLVTLKQMNRIRKNLSEPSARVSGGVQFEIGSEVENVFNQASDASSRSLKSASPELKESFSKISELRKIDDLPSIGALIDPNVKADALTRAGRAHGKGGQFERKILKRIDDLTGENFIPQAELLAGFDDASRLGLTPFSGPGGTATARTLTQGVLGTGLGSAISSATGISPMFTIPPSILGMQALTGPSALRNLLRLGRLPGQASGLLNTPARLGAFEVGKAIPIQEEFRGLLSP